MNINDEREGLWVMYRGRVGYNIFWQVRVGKCGGEVRELKRLHKMMSVLFF